MNPELCNLFSLDEKVALVTGASSGLGVAFARGLARAGASLVLTARRKEQLEQTAAMAAAFGVRTAVYPADITDDDQLQHVFDQTIAEFGRLDILVNNAGYTDRSGLRHDQSSMKRVRSIVELDLVATINGCRLAGQIMLEQPERGTIINVSSILGRVGSEFRAASYHAAKGGVDAFTR